MIKRWVHAQIALDEQNNPVGIIYGETSTFPNPQPKPSDNVPQMLKQLNHKNRIHHVTSIFPNDIS